MPSLTIIVALFALAAFIGLFLISYVLKGKTPPLTVALLHGLAAAGALAFLIAFSAKNRVDDFTGVLFIFCLAALGGFALIIRQLRHKSLPKWLAGLHGGLAVLGFILLVVMVFSAA